MYPLFITCCLLCVILGLSEAQFYNRYSEGGIPSYGSRRYAPKTVGQLFSGPPQRRQEYDIYRSAPPMPLPPTILPVGKVSNYYYKHHKPLDDRIDHEEAEDWRNEGPLNYQEYDEYSSSDDKKGKPYESLHSDSGYDKSNDEHHYKDYKAGGGKKFAKLDKHSDSGHKSAEVSKLAGAKDKQIEGRKELEHESYKNNGEYSHDRGHGFIKSWSWDRAHAKNDAAGQLTKKLAEHSLSDKAGYVAVKAKGEEGHDEKGVSAVAGAAGYGKEGKEESSSKSESSGKSDFDKEFPIFG